MYEIRLCKTDEVNLLTAFLNESWVQNHIFTRDINLLNFQHKSDRGYNFVVAYHVESNSFHGILGFVSHGFYIDRRIKKNEDVWLAIWKVDKSLAKASSLGMDMLKFVDVEFQPKSISAIGINKTVAFLYKAMGYDTPTMNQWFIPNKDIVEPKLIIGDLPDLPYDSEVNAYSALEYGIEQEYELQTFLSKNKARRTFRYIAERYLNHPSYRYYIYAIVNTDSNIHAVLVGREVSANGASAFRLTELFQERDRAMDVKDGLMQIMVQKGYEYIDFLEYGFDFKELVNNGFILCSDKLFVPHFFEPFDGDRKKVKLAFKSGKSFVCTKGDSDLDRPNLG
jgi:hypothetical protein